MCLEEELAFQLNHTDKSFHVFANSVADKNNWITNLRQNIAKASQGRGLWLSGIVILNGVH